MLTRRLFDRDVTALVSDEMEGDGFLVAFTERTGGVSEGSFRSLNLGLATDDDPEAVFENRRRAAGAFGLDRVAALRQRHGNGIVDVGDGGEWRGPWDRRRGVPEGDVLVSTTTGVGLVILTADCVPVALADPVAGHLAAVHAGWRGVAAGVVGAAVGRFEDPGRVRAVIGPAVGIDHYEVGQDVAAAVGAASPSGAVTSGLGPRIRLDLPGTVARILRDAGVERVDEAGICTACQADRFFSHRRDGSTGRQALVAGRR